MATRTFRKLGRSGMLVSPLCLGAMNFGNAQFGCDEKTSIAIINAYLEAGHNFIDTANVYSAGLSETIVGKAVKARRENVVIATKAAGPMGPGAFQSGTSRKHVMRAVEDSLRRLDTDYIDLYQMHRLDDQTPVEETMATLNDIVRQGKARFIGISNWTASAIVEAVMLTEHRGWEPPVSLQPQYSIIARDIEVEIVPVCLKFGLGIIPWSPLAGGVLTGKYLRGKEPAADMRFGAPGPFQKIWRERLLRDRNYDIVDAVLAEARKLDVSPIALSLAWNLDRPGVVAPIIGPKSVQQLNDNLAALDLVLPAETVNRIDEVSQPVLGYPHDFLRMMRQMLEQMRSAPAKN
ncbi:MAG: aldo/keto reductase [Gammaproteobacteria bacterium]|nr:aldo/keto reductase [Gammaproteobacteria bacterium]